MLVSLTDFGRMDGWVSFSRKVGRTKIQISAQPRIKSRALQLEGLPTPPQPAKFIANEQGEWRRKPDEAAASDA